MMHLALTLLVAMSTLSQASNDSWLRLRMAKSLDKIKKGTPVDVKVDDANLGMFILRAAGTQTEKTYTFKQDTEIAICEPVIDTKREQYVSIKQIETHYRSNSSLKTWFSRKTGGFTERDGERYKKADLYFTMDENVRRGRPYGKQYRKFTEWLQKVMRARPRARNPVQQRRVANPARKKGCSVMGALEGLNRGLHNCGEKVKSFVNKHEIFGPPGLPMFPRGNASKKKVGGLSVKPTQQRRRQKPSSPRRKRVKGCSVMGALEGLKKGLDTCGEKIKSFVNKHEIFGPPGLPMFPSKKRVGAGNPPSSGDTRATRRDHDEEKTREPSARSKQLDDATTRASAAAACGRAHYLRRQKILKVPAIRVGNSSAQPRRVITPRYGGDRLGLRLHPTKAYPWMLTADPSPRYTTPTPSPKSARSSSSCYTWSALK